MKVYLIHHSHTDLGYTELPTKTLEAQIGYIDFLIEYFTEYPETDFKWNCETMYVIEKWLINAKEEEVNKFFQFVREGKIGLSANYLNMSDFCDSEIYESKVTRCIEQLSKYGQIKSYIQADVNGLAIHFAKTLIKNGVENIYACVHTHHGMFPTFKKHAFFEWEIDGKVLNVFSSEHYMFGNGFGFAPGAITHRGFGDDDLYDDYRLGKKPLIELSKRRLDIYVENLKKDGYEDDFLSFGIHGKFIDNAMPNPEIAKQIAKFNEVYSDEYTVELVTLDEFFEKTKDIKKPRYQGDWPDWWTDGIISAPREVKLCKNITSKYKQIKLLDTNHITEEDADIIEENLIIYGEHTYGSWDSISNPYAKFASEQWALKQNVLFDTLKLVTNLENEILKDYGIEENGFKVAKKFKAYNPYNYSIEKHFRLPISGSDWISLNGKYKIYDNNGFEYIYNTKQGKVQELWDVFPEIVISLAAGEEKIITIEQIDTMLSEPMTGINQVQVGGTDGVNDLAVKNNLEYYFSATTYRNRFLEITWDKNGIHKIINKSSGKNLLNGNGYLFRPVYEVSTSTPRHLMGRNRKGIEVERCFGTLACVDLITENKLYSKIMLTYSVKGMGIYKVKMVVSNYNASIEFNVKVGKDTSYMPENVYLEMPIANGERDIIFSKGESNVKPLDYQLPGTLIDYYSVYEGVKIEGDVDFSIATLDTQLIHVGDLEYRERNLFEEPSKVNELYIWVMNNIWETNFVANIGGFYEFRFVLDFNDNNDPRKNHGEIVLIPIKE